MTEHELTDQLIRKVRNWLQVEWRLCTAPVVSISAHRFYDFLLSIDAPVLKTTEYCIECRWVEEEHSPNQYGGWDLVGFFVLRPVTEGESQEDPDDDRQPEPLWVTIEDLKFLSGRSKRIQRYLKEARDPEWRSGRAARYHYQIARLALAGQTLYRMPESDQEARDALRVRSGCLIDNGCPVVLGSL